MASSSSSIRKDFMDLNLSSDLKSKSPILEGLSTLEAARFLAHGKNGRKNYDDSFYICDLGKVVRLYEEWKVLFPRVDPFYAIKVAPYGPMTACLASIGAGFDCASQKEIEMVLSNGGSPRRIVFSNPSKHASHIVHARNNGVEMLVFDNEEEILKTKKFYPSASLVLRIKTDDSGSDWGFSTRFGASVKKGKVLLKRVKELGMSAIGISFHVGSGSNESSSYATAIGDSRELFDYAASIGMTFSLLDIGGGFQGVDKQAKEKASLAVNMTLNELFPTEQFPSLHIIAEPGRYFAASSFTLATNVICKAVAAKESDVEVEYTINEGKYGNLMWSTDCSPGEYEPHHLKNSESERKYLNSRVWGPALDSSDVIYKKRSMPEMEVGEWLIFKNAGAYSFSTASNFNGFGAEKFYNIVSPENAEVFRRRQQKSKI